MRSFFLLLLIGLYMSGSGALAQADTVVLHDIRYPNGKRSAWAWYVKSTQEGVATCFTPEGKVMYSGTISHRHGVRSVEFRHHENKVVSQVHEHSAPDAGIQWYNTYLEFDEQGRLVRTWENNWDDRVTLEVPPPYPAPYVEPTHIHPDRPPHDSLVSECAVLFSNRTWFINSTPFPLNVTYTARGDTIHKDVQPGDTVAMGNMVQAQFFEPPVKTAGFHASSPVRKSRKYLFDFQPAGERKRSATEMDYFYRIRAILK